MRLLSAQWDGREASSGFDIWQRHHEDQVRSGSQGCRIGSRRLGKKAEGPISIDEMTEALLLYSLTNQFLEKARSATVKTRGPLETLGWNLLGKLLLPTVTPNTTQHTTTKQTAAR